MKTTSKDAGQMKLRLPHDLKNALRVEAATNERTLNAEALNRLRSSFMSNRTQHFTLPKSKQ